MDQPSERGAFWPTIMLVIAAAAWGLFWIPLREFEAAGLSPGWASAVPVVIPVPLPAPVAI